MLPFRPLGQAFAPLGRPSTPAPAASPFAFRDLFTAAQDPALTGSATPGPGNRTLIGSRGKIIDGALRGMTQTSSPAWGSSAYVGPGHSRAAGTVTQFYFIPADPAADGFVGLTDTASGVDPRANAHGLVWENGALSVATAGAKLPIYTGQRNARPIEYIVTVIEYASAGAAVLLSTAAADQSHGMDGPIPIPAWPQARLLYTTMAGTAGTLYPAASFLGDVGGYVNGQLVDDVRVIPAVPEYAIADPLPYLVDRFSRSNSTTALGNGWTAIGDAVYGINSFRAYVQGGSGFIRAYRSITAEQAAAGYTIRVDVNWSAGAIPFFGLTLAGQSDTVFARLFNNGASNQLALQTVNGGTITAVSQTGAGVNFVANTWYRLESDIYNGQALMRLNGQPLNGWQTDSTGILTGGGLRVGLVSSLPSGGTLYYDNFQVLPLAVTLPITVQAGAAPSLATAGATVAADTFGGSGSLDAHTPDQGGPWVEPVGLGNFAVSSNRASADRTTLDSNGTLAAVMDTGSPYGQIDVTVHTAATYTTGQVRAGIILNWLSNQQYLAVRLFRDPVTQAGSDEIELIEVIAGSALIQRKVNIGNILLANGAYQLRVQRYLKTFPGGNQRHIVQVLLWDGSAWRPRLTHTPSMNFAATSHGLYLASNDDASTFSAWSVKAVTP